MKLVTLAALGLLAGVGVAQAQSVACNPNSLVYAGGQHCDGDPAAMASPPIMIPSGPPVIQIPVMGPYARAAEAEKRRAAGLMVATGRCRAARNFALREGDFGLAEEVGRACAAPSLR